MATNFWASKATKKRNELVPGTSKWVANELSTVNDVVLTHNEQVFQALQERLGHMNGFMMRILQGQHDKSFVQDILKSPAASSPSNFTYISPTFPSTSNPPATSSPIKKRVPSGTTTTSNPIQRFTPKTPSPLKSQSHLNSSYGAKSSSKNTSVPKQGSSEEPVKESPINSGIDDSFQAISTAIRKSIAGRSALKPSIDQEVSAKPPAAASKSYSSEVARSSMPLRDDAPSRRTTKTPKRSSIFVSLPSREPITIKSAKSSKRHTGFGRSSKAFEKTEVNSADSLAPNNLILSPVPLPTTKSFQPRPPIETKVVSLQEKPSKPILSKSLDKANNDQSTGTVKYQPLKDSKIPVLTKKSPEYEPEYPNMISPSKPSTTELDVESKSEERPRLNTSLRKSPVQSRSPRKVTSPKKIVKSPTKRSPVKYDSTRTKSPSKSPRSPIKPETSEKTPSGTPGHSELINRLMAPTSSSAAKSKTPTQVQKPTADTRKNDTLNTKNRFLTTTLIPSAIQFNPQKPPILNSTTKATLASPTKGKHEEETKRKSEYTASLKKKSMMAERSEAAAQKPKQKILISMNHKIDLKPSKETRATQNIPKSVEIPVERAKRRKIQEPLVEDKKPKERAQKKPTPVKNRIPSDTRTPRTPAASNNSVYLPEIHTDDEEDDGNKDSKILKSWGHTPELHKLVMSNKDVNPATVFGAVPKLNIEEIFESSASRYRGKQSPNVSPNEKQRQYEERQYVLEMGYKGI